MIKLFGRSDEVLSQHRRAGGELGVFHLHLSGVEDPFDPDPMWDRRYGGGADIVDKTSGDGEFRLQAALDGCRNSVFIRDEAGRFRERNPVFTDVVVRIPNAAWRTEAVRGGRRIEALARNLEHLHNGKFMGSLPNDRNPIYTIMPDPGLPSDEAVFQFGFGVFVPSGEDVLLGSVTIARGRTGEPQELPEWSFWYEGRQIKRPVAVYRGQKTVLIAPGDPAPVRAPVWFDSPGGHILINLNAADSERIYADAEHIQVVESRLPETATEPFEWTLESRHGSRKGRNRDLLVVRLAPIAEPKRLCERDVEIRLFGPPPEQMPTERRGRSRKTSSEHAAPVSRTNASDRESGGGAEFGIEPFLTGLSPGWQGDATPLSSRYALRLAGLALLRVDGERRVDNLDGWALYFDADGDPIGFDRADTVDTRRCLALAAYARDRRLFYRLAGESSFSPVAEIPCVLPTERNRYLRLDASPLPDHYHGVLLLREEIGFPLSPKGLVLGRSNLDPEAQQPDLPLELLTHPESLHWTGGQGHPGARLNAINLSRRHVTLQLKDDALAVTMAEGTAPVFLLDSAGRHLRTLEPRSRRRARLKPGEMLVVGGYLLRFHREVARTLMSSEHSVLRRRQ